VEPEVQAVGLLDGDRLLLCTDGLSDMITDETIRALLGSGYPSQEVARLLVDRALEAGGTDNVTVIVALTRLPGGLGTTSDARSSAQRRPGQEIHKKTNTLYFADRVL
jgi:serine/threonine protein phosphatase PrpC